MSTQVTAEKSAASTVRVTLGLIGLLALIAGILVLAWPVKVAEVVVAIIAIYAIVAGAVYAALGVFSKTRSGWARAGHIVLGLLFIVAGIVALANLATSTLWFAVFFGVFVGVAWILEGIVSLSTLRDSDSKGVTIFFAILSILAGMILVSSPLWAAALLWLLIGLSLAVLGTIQIVRAFTFNRRRSDSHRRTEQTVQG